MTREEIHERNLKIMNLTHFHPKRIENFGKKNNSSVNIRHQKSFSKHQNWQHWLQCCQMVVI